MRKFLNLWLRILAPLIVADNIFPLNVTENEIPLLIQFLPCNKLAVRVVGLLWQKYRLSSGSSAIKPKIHSEFSMNKKSFSFGCVFTGLLHIYYLHKYIGTRFISFHIIYIIKKYIYTYCSCSAVILLARIWHVISFIIDFQAFPHIILHVGSWIAFLTQTICPTLYLRQSVLYFRCFQ